MVEAAVAAVEAEATTIPPAVTLHALFPVPSQRLAESDGDAVYYATPPPSYVRTCQVDTQGHTCWWAPDRGRIRVT